jgi:hypothetical protein
MEIHGEHPTPGYAKGYYQNKLSVMGWPRQFIVWAAPAARGHGITLRKAVEILLSLSDPDDKVVWATHLFEAYFTFIDM